jgi:hypothetical protein
MSEPKKIKGLLESVSGSLGKLDDLEQRYNEARGNLVSELISYLDQLAAAADSQATRAQVVRELYWNRNISPELIGEAFKLKKHTLRKVAGALVFTLPCPNECGNSVKREFKSRLKLKNYHRETGRSHRRSYVSYLACDECKRKAEAERETEETSKRQRNLELQNLAWENFTETEEWRKIRNDRMHFASYSCERCHDSGVGLFVYLGKDTPQNYPHFSRGEYQYYILCGGCIPACEELINPKKGEYIKGEFVGSIRDANQGIYSEDAMYDG